MLGKDNPKVAAHVVVRPSVLDAVKLCNNNIIIKTVSPAVGDTFD